MKNNKLVLLIVIAILLITGAVVFTLTRNNVNATTVTNCPNCYHSQQFTKCGTKCNACGYTYHINYTKSNDTHSCTSCGLSESHKIDTWVSDDTTLHSGTCTICMRETFKEHEYGWVDGLSFSDSVNHALYCVYCKYPDYDLSEPHEDLNEDGVCDEYGCEYVIYCNHSDSKIADYKWPTCEEDGYRLCTCGYEYIIPAVKHDYSDWWNNYQYHNVFCSKCEESYYFEMQKHTFEDSVCTAEVDGSKCGYECNHEDDKGNSLLEWTYVSKTKCTVACSNCDYVGTEKSHNEKYTEINNKYHKITCTRCLETLVESEKHSNDGEPEKYKEATCTEDGYEYFECEDGCGYSEKHTIDALGHIDENNDGICDRENCEEELCDHEDGEYKYNDTKHWWECDDCDYVGSKKEHDKKLSSKSYEATCIEEGKYIYQCEVCDWEKEVTTDPLGHSLSEPTCTEPAKCQRKGCTYTEGTALGHIDENKDGKCDRCGYTMSVIVPHTHTPKTTYETDATYHWKICSDTTCNQIIGVKEAHIDNNKDGKCDTCEYIMSTVEPECTHSNKEWKYGEDEHWKVCKDCEKEIAGTREKHTYENGKCECGKECEHKNTTPKSDDTHHWDECNDCGEILNKEEHSYKDGECECGKEEDKKEDDKKDEDNINDDDKEDDNKEDSNKDDDNKNDEEECKHTNKEWKSNGDEHWQACKDCKDEIEGTRGKHVYVDGKCKNCGLKDSTSSTTTLPNTGREENMEIAVMITLAILGSALLIKLSREE